jgi:CubicO group peptidase (beta-lactamase class C family)
MKRIGLFCTVAVIGVFGAAQVYSIDQISSGEESREPVKQKPAGDNSTAPSNPGGGILLSGDCSDYTDLTGQSLPIIVTGNTSGATNNYGPYSSKPLCWSESGWWPASGAAPDVTYKWTAPTHGRYKISLLGSGYDTVLLLYDFTCPIEPLYPDDFICGNDDFEGTRSQLTYVPLDQGQEILIVVDGYSGNTGSFRLTISEIQTAPIDTFMNNIMDSYPIPGMQACVVKDGQVIWTGCYGDAYIGLTEVTDSTIFSLASISKTVSSTALMQLYEEEIIGLDSNVNNYLPFQIINPNAPGSTITSRMLLAHTSAINDNWNIMYPLTVPGDSPVSLDTFLVNYLVSGGYYYSTSNYNNYPPVTYFDYSNVGNCVAALIVELNNPDSLSFDQYCQNNIFTPLGMDKTKWFLADYPDTMEIAMPYRANLTPLGHYGRPYYPSGQLRSSSLQMARFLMAFMQYGQLDTVRILDSSSVELMNTIQYPEIPRDVGHPGEAGLGWFHVELFNKEFWGHLGRTGGVETGMFYCADESTGVIVLSNEHNTGVFPDENMFAIYELFELASGWPYGYVSGVVTDETMNPIEDVYVNASGTSVSDYSSAIGEYMLHYLPPGTHDISFSHANYFDTTITGVAITAGDTAVLDMQMILAGCEYVPGDVNGSTNYNGLFKYGSPVPQCAACGLCPDWHYCGDVNNSCNYNGLDITYGVNYFKYGSPAPQPCADCPPVE